MLKILCIGTCSDIKRSRFTGQSVMFDGVVNHLIEHGVEVRVVDISHKINKEGLLFRSMDYLLILPEVLWELIMHKFDLCYITTSQSKKGFLRDNAMITLCRWFKVPVITHQYGANYHQLLDTLGESGTVKLLKMLGYVSTIIVEGDYMKEQFSFMPDYRSKVRVIPNGLPIEGKHAQVPKTYDGNHPFVMLYLSNLIWSKGYFDVLQAVDILVNRDHLDVKCVFVGKFMASVDDERPDISSKEFFDQYVKVHHLEKVVRYYPGMYGDQKDEAFATSHVFLLPTYYINEGQPVSIIEAMAYGCVPIVTKYRHIPMMVNKENGCFVEPKMPYQIAKAITRVMKKQDIYAAMSEACIMDYKEKFTFEKYASNVISVLSESSKKK